MSYGGSSDVFGNEKDDSFKGSIGAIYQTFAGQEVYPSLEEQICYTLLQRIILFQMEIKGLLLLFSCILWIGIRRCFGMAKR